MIPLAAFLLSLEMAMFVWHGVLRHVSKRVVYTVVAIVYNAWLYCGCVVLMRGARTEYVVGLVFVNLLFGLTGLGVAFMRKKIV